MNERIEDELDKQFPKGDKARGRALVLHAIAQIEFRDLQDAYDIAMEEINKLRRKVGYDKIPRKNEKNKEEFKGKARD